MRADIFCRVIDNLGDIGVCWRLARRLAHGRRWQVRLWVDDLAAFARIQPGIAPDRDQQVCDTIEILRWDDRAEWPQTPGDVVIEAFACDPPPAYVAAMRRFQPVWINLEYLSAEAWVETCHGLPSQRADGLVKHFFFPGFSAATGGLIREPGLSRDRDALQTSRAQQRTLLRALGLDEAALARRDDGARLVNLFCYPDAPYQALAHALMQDARPTLLLVPQGVAPGLPEPGQHGQLTLARVPYVSQPDFDRLLWCADLNCVRGEDSFVRAAWAARPLLWQIYAQAENAHLEKLQAWLARYPAPAAAHALMRAWNQAPGAPAPQQALAGALAEPAWGEWNQAARAWDAAQAARPDLGDALADFCAELAKTS